MPPSPADIDWTRRDAWYLALPLATDPLPLRVIDRLGLPARRGADRITIKVFENANHFMLESRTGSIEELPTLPDS